MKCKELKELISAYVDGALNQTQYEFIEKHMAVCEECRRIRDGYISIKSSIQRLPEVPVPEGLFGTVMTRISKQPTGRGKRRPWLRSLVFVGVTVLMTTILLGAPHIVPDTPAVKAESIIRNSPEIQAVLQGEHMVDVEVTTEVVDEEGKVLMRMIRTETRAFAVEVDLENRKITEIIEVALPEFTEEHERKAQELALADSGVQELLARGGKITGVNPGYGFNTIPNGSVESEQPEILPYLTAFVSIQLDGERWQAMVLLDGDTRVPAVMLMPASDTNFNVMNNIMIGFAGPVMLLMTVFLLYDVLIRKRPTGRLVAGAAVVYAVLGLYLGLLGWWPEGRPQVIIFGLSLSGILMGIIVLRTQGVWKWAAIVGTIFGSVGFAWAGYQLLGSPGVGVKAFVAVAIMVCVILVFLVWNRSWKLPVSEKSLGRAFIALVVITLFLLIVQPWSGSLSPEAVVASAGNPEREVHSYRMSYSSEEFGDTSLPSTRVEASYVTPDRFQMTSYTGDWITELIYIGEARYVRTVGTPEGYSSRLIVNTRYVPHREMTVKLLENLTSFESLGDGIHDGVACYRLQGIYKNPDPLPDYLLEEWVSGRITQEQYHSLMEKYSESFRETDVTLWISKHDYLIMKIEQETRNSVGELVQTLSMMYFDINNAIIIEPPHDEYGNLLPGWRMVDTPPTSSGTEYPAQTPVGTGE